MNSSRNPIARKDGLVIQELPDEILVYDLNTSKAYCLNETAAFVWRRCDGETGIADFADMLEKESGKAVPEDVVLLAIDQLSDKGLLEGKLESAFNGQTRRQVIKKIGVAAAVAVPFIASIAAPTSVMAAASCACTPVGPPCPMACPSMTCNPVGECAPPPPPVSA